MNEALPVICTLTPGELKDREGAWRKVLDSGLVERTRTPGGIRLVAAPGAVRALTDLVDLERDCCAWIKFTVPAPGTFVLTAEGDGREVLATMFVAPEGT